MVVLVWLGTLAATAAGASLPPLTAKAAIVVDRDSGEVLFERHADEPRPVASLTKIMTAIVACENASPSDNVRVSAEAAAVGEATAHLVAGETIPFRDLLAMVLLPSANDAAYAVAEHVGGSEAGFAAMMNEKAEELGCRNTRFSNAHGLDADFHYSSARDAATMARYFLSIPLCRDLASTREIMVDHPARPGRKMKLVNRNLLVFWRDDVDGVKTGTTRGAGECLAASARRGDRGYIAVVLGSEGRFHECDRLLTWAFDTFEVLPVLVANDTIALANLLHGEEDSVGVASGETVELLLRVDRPPPQPRFVQTVFEAPVYRGDVIGYFEFTHRDQPYRTTAVAMGTVYLQWWRRVFGWPQGALLMGAAVLLSVCAGMVAHRAMQGRSRRRKRVPRPPKPRRAY